MSLMSKYRVNIFIAVFFLFSVVSAIDAQVIINEFMASNTSIIPDMADFDDYSDWIELHNTSDQEVDLSDYYLSDNLNDPKKWSFPAGSKIDANGYLLIWADGNDAGPGQEFIREFYPWDIEFTTKGYHACFKLSADGEEIVLSKDSDNSVVTVDSVIFSDQLSDISMGRNPSENNVWYKYDMPTPGEANTTDAKQIEQFSGSVSFSVPGGFYTGPQTVVLSSSSGDIYYTLDGSIPTIYSSIYSSPITIDKTTPLRARVIESDKLAGEVETNTYFIGKETRDLMCINISTDTSLLYDNDIGIFENSLKGREIPVSMEFYTTEGDQVINVNAGIWVGSLTNFTCPQKPIQVGLKGKYGDDEIWYQLFDKQAACYADLRLRQGGDGWSSNLICDGMLESICKNRLELGAQAYRPVVVFINGKYYGIHDLREKFDDQYFFNNYDVDPSTKDEVRSILMPPDSKEGWEVVSGSWDSWQSIVDFVKNNSMDDPQKYNEIKSKVDINSLIDFVSIQEFGCNVSWGHNEDMWKVAGSKWKWLVTDFDRCFNYSSRYNDVSTDNLNEGGGGLSGSIIEQDTLFSRLLGNEEFKNYFIQRFAAHLNSTFAPSRMNKIVDSLAAILMPEMEEYTEKWGREGGIESIDAWQSSIDSVKRFIEERGGYVFEHLSHRNFAGTETVNLTISLSMLEAGDIYINGVLMDQGLSEMDFLKDVPFQIKAVARPGYVFAGWSSDDVSDSITLTLTSDRTIEANFEISQEHTIENEITENTTFNLTDNPYVASGDIHIPEGVTLTIEKGVTVLMPQDADIYVYGRLLINGTEDSPVTIKTNKKANAESWGAISFYNSTDTSKMVYLNLSGTRLGNDPLNERAGINGNNSHVIMDHLTVKDVVYPFYFEGGSTVLKNSHILIEHICNGGIHIGRGGALVENNTWISTGKTMNTDAIDIKGVDNGIVRGNRLYNFNGDNSDGIDLGEDCNDILIEGNYIYGNRDKGISCGGSSTCKIKNNIIVGCDLGIGIKDEGSVAEIDHNTFVRNRIAVAAYTKVYGRGGGVAKVKNCILSGSIASSFYTDEFSSVTISYSISDRDLLPGKGNIYNDPLFMDMLNNNFQLREKSPCMDTGDPESPKDEDGSVTDMGAQYTYNEIDFPDSLTTPYQPLIVINEIMNDDDSENPGGDWIELHNPTDQDISLADWKLCDIGPLYHWEYDLYIEHVDSSDIFFFPQNTVIKAGEFLVVARSIDTFKTAFSDVQNCIGDLPFGISEEESFFLYNDSDSLVTVLSYSSNAPWAKRESGVTMGLKNPAELSYMPVNWGVSSGAGSTPGQQNVITSVRKLVNKTVPERFYLGQNFPNPFRYSTTIRFALPKDQFVNISVYNIAGQLMETLVNREMRSGVHNLLWDARKYSSGVYFYRINTELFNQTRKITVK